MFVWAESIFGLSRKPMGLPVPGVAPSSPASQSLADGFRLGAIELWEWTHYLLTEMTKYKVQVR